MAMRHCDGTDPNLTRTIPADEFDPERMTLSHWDSTARSGERIVNCACGLMFDDDDRRVVYPHQPVRVRGILGRVNAMVKLANVADKAVGLPIETVEEVLERAIQETALVEALVMIHGDKAGLERYYQHGGSIVPDRNGEPWIAVDIP